VPFWMVSVSALGQFSDNDYGQLPPEKIRPLRNDPQNAHTAGTAHFFQADKAKLVAHEGLGVSEPLVQNESGKGAGEGVDHRLQLRMSYRADLLLQVPQ